MKPSSTIVHLDDYTGPMGVKRLKPRTHRLRWFDPVDGDVVTQTVSVTSEDSATWEKPPVVGVEVALHITRR